MGLLQSIAANYYFLFAILLFLIGIYTMLTHPNLLKKVIGLNIMETSVFLLFVSGGYVAGGRAPIVTGNEEVYVNPLPHALILTGIVIAISITSLLLSLIVKIYKYYGTLNADKISKMRG
ncbi:cation:proton antiporter subunit C [Natranaerobius thermophilus JW/NM-WN-LF]|uniref:NADH-ubiquinone oxidoreductase chain 4L n=1 Tax=Natranaerobius thermophilus (strain ATCC BAA-1301 / DSM 18059 / JW/NM-WN-LF) TaxID=457570 RepID=B2A692_NATTJ|nr:cation:proton antiporter subunit C [Natranaerobius thermophilus]ACB84103.1 NADH-ubiquinone oxidoreductase chain 4L [Natranaerobius thermophilus JW/NM-WN-LF]